MAIKGKMSRRSFLTTIAGPSIATGAMATITGSALSQETEPPEIEERVRPTDPPTGFTDRDYGVESDFPDYGRAPVENAPERTYLTDQDTGFKSDSPGYGRQRSTGESDADSEPVTDRAGFGAQPPEHCSDTDIATEIEAGDKINQGRFCTPDPMNGPVNSYRK
jgi:hypothetical protein